MMCVAALVTDPARVDAQRVAVSVEGSARLEGYTVSFSCRENAAEVDCVSVATFELVALSAVELRQGEGCEALSPGHRIICAAEVDDRTLIAPRELSAGERAHVRVELQGLSRRPPRPGVVAPLAPITLRHPLLAERHRRDRENPPIEAIVVLPVRGPGLSNTRARLETDAERMSLEEVDGDSAVRFAGPDRERRATDIALAHGGPVLMVGADTRGLARFAAGYEADVYEYLVLSLFGEVTESSVSQALLLEAALPGMLIVLPSLSAGIGIVVRESFDGAVDGALRIRLAVQSYSLGLVGDIDYRFATDDWQGWLSLRVGL